MDYALNLDNVSYKYGKSVALNNASFSIEESSFFVLLGLNGAGKSTIFSLITRLLSMQSGSISLNGFNIEDYKNALKNIGIVFQEPTLDLDLTVQQNLFFYGSLQGLSLTQTMQSIKSEITNLHLEDKLNTIVKKLNGGHRRRVEILRALINKPKILLLDEATIGLDVKTRFEILNYIRGMVKNKNISVLWITHLFDEVEPSDKIAIIKNGTIIESDILSNLFSKYNQNSLAELFKDLTK